MTTPDAPGGTFHHWIAYDIPADRRRLDAGHGAESVGGGFVQAANDFGNSGYGGPCPPRNHGDHRYHFRLCALFTDHLPVGPSAGYDEVLAVAKPYIIDEAEIIGLYHRH